MKSGVTVIALWTLCLIATGATTAAGQTPGNMAAGSYDWTGGLIGVHGGGNWSQSTSQTTNTVTGNPTGPASSSSGSHVNGGVLGGYDYMTASRMVVGAVAGASVWGLTDSSTTSEGNAQHTSATKTDWAGSALIRIGYGARRSLLYGTGGLTFSSGSTSRTQVTGTTGNAVPGTVETLQEHHTNWTAGVGWAFVAAPHAWIVAEYHYSPSSNTNTFPIAERSTSSVGHTNGIQVGVSYKF